MKEKQEILMNNKIRTQWTIGKVSKMMTFDKKKVGGMLDAYCRSLTDLKPVTTTITKTSNTLKPSQRIKL